MAGDYYAQASAPWRRDDVLPPELRRLDPAGAGVGGVLEGGLQMTPGSPGDDPGRHDHHEHEHREHRHGGSRWGSAEEYLANWRSYEGSLARKVGLAARNLTLGRLRHGTCCGNYGQPGC
ncbi:MAG: hypothetical protein ABR518_00900 [Actinomycetota bacterium]